MQIDGVSIYQDLDKDGQVTEADSLLAGPFTYDADDGELDLVLLGVIVAPNDPQQWIIIYKTSQAVQESITFSTRITSALAVDAEYLSLGMAAIPEGSFPVASDEFMVELTLETFYQDGDSDGYGDPNVSIVAYIIPEGYVPNHLDCDDNDADINPDAEEICDSKDNNCDSLVDGENAEGCTTYYKDEDEDGHGVDEDHRCLCTADLAGKYTTILPGDPDDSDPDAQGSYIAVNMVLAEGWNMISLPVVPIDRTIRILFPEAIAVFEFTTRYELLDLDDPLDTGKGYWLYLPGAKTYSMVGLPIDHYTLPNMGADWSMIGACSYPTHVSVSSGTIRAVFGFSTKYDLMGSGNNVGPLGPGKGYWINLSEQADITASQ